MEYDLKCYLQMKIKFAQKSRLVDKKGIFLPDLITSANTTDIEAVIDVIDNAIIKRGFILFHQQKDKEESIIRNSRCVLIEYIIINQ
jgi:hypothetical protein